ncbi:MAG: hypothetical protein KC940_10990, partial [Candidatus Omnitrophica bacterium]|nr:hypothetical protein [Candidatus Omnitrophota bacterium]
TALSIDRGHSPSMIADRGGDTMMEKAISQIFGFGARPRLDHRAKGRDYKSNRIQSKWRE